MQDVNRSGLEAMLAPARVSSAALTGLGIHGERLLRRGSRLQAATEVAWHSSGEGPPLLLLSGYAVSGLFWPTAWLHDLETRYRVLRIDNRGTGIARSAAGPFTIADLADDAVSVLDRAGDRTATVVGLSMGGMVAQELALRHPERVDRLVLVSTVPPAPALVPPTAFARLIAAGRTRQIDPTFGPQLRWVLRFYLAAACRDLPPEVVAEMATQLHQAPTSLGGLLQQGRAISAWAGAARLRAISAPTTVLQGAGDLVVAPANGRRIARLVPDSEYVELPGVGHLVPWEAPEALDAALRRQ